MKLRIAYIVPSFPVTTETFVVNQITDMIDRGHEITIYAFKNDREAVVHQKVSEYNLLNKTIYYNEFNIGLGKAYMDLFSFLVRNYWNINFFKLIKAAFHSGTRQALKLRFYLKYKWILDGNNPEIVHVHFADRAKLIANMKEEGLFSSSRLIVSLHGYDLEPSQLNRLKAEYENVFKTSDLFTVNTVYSKSLLDKISKGKQIQVLPVGLDTAEFRKGKSKDKTYFNILFVGRLIEFKGPDFAIKIVKTVIDRGISNLKLTIIGDGEMFDELSQLIVSNDLINNVVLKGALSQSEIIEEMEAGDIFLLPGKYDKNGRAETQGLVIQEAQAMELPVVVSNAGGMKYGLIHNETGYVVEEGDLEAFANRIEFLFLNEKERRIMGFKGRKFVEQKFDSRVLGAKLETLYFELLQKRNNTNRKT
jgi:colanic acid/amylovoran biosynthesis glycosyltransferase